MVPEGYKELSPPGATAATIRRLAEEVAAAYGDANDLAVVGVHTGGVMLASRIVAVLTQLNRPPVATGTVDITLYRDDLSQIGPAPIVHATDIRFAVEGMAVLLVDDVIYTGRTARAAINNLMDLGRPKRIQLLALVDRGGRELPIQPDFVGLRTQIGDDYIVEVIFDNAGDRVIARPRPAPESAPR